MNIRIKVNQLHNDKFIVKYKLKWWWPCYVYIKRHCTYDDFIKEFDTFSEAWEAGLKMFKQEK